MTEQQREVIAKALYRAYVSWHKSKVDIEFVDWGQLGERAKNMYRFMAESVIAAYRRLP